jgi:hypothetical protein
MVAPAPTVIAMLALVSFAAGLVDAIAGGGGLLTVPALLAAGLPPHVVLGTNKGQAVFGAVASFGSFWSKGEVDKPRAPIGFSVRSGRRGRSTSRAPRSASRSVSRARSAARRSSSC